MSEMVLAESIYTKQSKSTFGTGVTLKEKILETFWFPNKIENGLVELLLVTNDFQNILGISENVPVEQFEKEYSAKDDTYETYMNLKNMMP
jgi:hypothetical protein